MEMERYTYCTRDLKQLLEKLRETAGTLEQVKKESTSLYVGKNSREED